MDDVVEIGVVTRIVDSVKTKVSIETQHMKIGTIYVRDIEFKKDG